jgi:hypothetical protein
MPASKSGKHAKPRSGVLIRRYASADTKIPARLGGGVLKQYVVQEIPSGKLRRYSVAYINPAIFAADNGVYLATITRTDFLIGISWE